MSSFDSGFSVGYIIGKKKGGGGDDSVCEQGRLDVEESIIANAGIVVKVGAIPTFAELVTGIYTILANYPLRIFNLIDTVDIIYPDVDDDLVVTFPDMLLIDEVETLYNSIIGYTDEVGVTLT